MILTNACEPVSCTSSSKCTKSRYALQDGFDINYYIVPGRRMILNMRLSLHMQVNRLNYQGVHTLGPQPTFLEHGSCLTFCSRLADATGSYELQTSINAQEAGAKDMQSFPYSSYSYDNVLPSLLPHIIRWSVLKASVLTRLSSLQVLALKNGPDTKLYNIWKNMIEPW